MFGIEEFFFSLQFIVGAVMGAWAAAFALNKHYRSKYNKAQLDLAVKKIKVAEAQLDDEIDQMYERRISR